MGPPTFQFQESNGIPDEDCRINKSVSCLGFTHRSYTAYDMIPNPMFLRNRTDDKTGPCRRRSSRSSSTPIYLSPVFLVPPVLTDRPHHPHPLSRPVLKGCSLNLTQNLLRGIRSLVAFTSSCSQKINRTRKINQRRFRIVQRRYSILIIC